jgi:hypothetical protein
MDRKTFILWTKEDRLRAVRAVMFLTRGWRVEIKAPKRTLPQNSRLWAMLTDVSEQANWNGEILTPTEWKDMFTAAVKIAANPGSIRAVQGLEGGLMLLGLHTSDMGVGEMADLLTYIESWGVERGVEFHDGQGPGSAEQVSTEAA